MSNISPKYSNGKPFLPVCSMNFSDIYMQRFYKCVKGKDITHVYFTHGKEKFLVDERKIHNLLRDNLKDIVK